MTEGRIFESMAFRHITPQDAIIKSHIPFPRLRRAMCLPTLKKVQLDQLDKQRESGGKMAQSRRTSGTMRAHTQVRASAFAASS